MRKHFTWIAAILFFCTINLSAQEEIHFKVGFKPGKRYHTTSYNNQLVNVKFVGPPTYLEDLKKKGMPDTRKVSQDIFIDANVETSKSVDANGVFTLEMTFNKLKIGSDSSSLPADMKLFGHASENSMFVIDSMESTKLDASTKKQVIPMFQKMFSQVTFPEATLKKGQAFSHEIPLKMPLGNTLADLKIVTKYTLMNINGDVAILAVSQVIQMSSSDSKNPIVATGDGDGEILYDIKNGYYKKYQVTSSMKMHLKTDKVEAKEDLNGYIDQKATIESY